MDIPTPSSVPTTRADKLKGVAFQVCKVATVSLIAGRFTLPVAAGLCSVLYGAVFVLGKRNTRCVLRYPSCSSLFGEWSRPYRSRSSFVPIGLQLFPGFRGSGRRVKIGPCIVWPFIQARSTLRL